MEKPKKYSPAVEEEKWKEFWSKSTIYAYDPSSKKPVYSIDTPPPYASAGHLHIGHAMSYTHTDIIARYKRMNGFNVFYPMGFDDNGLPTERFVEKKHNVNKNKITKAEFVKLCLEETRKCGETYKEMFSKLGVSVDWKQLYSTIQPRSVRVSQKSFLDLYKKGKLVRRKDPVIWDVSLQSSLSQADLDDLEKHSFLNDIAFADEEGNQLIIATTRPELIPGCVALFVNGEDTRYKHLIGKKAVVPITNHTVPILADDEVKIDFGTGLMMVCTWGDAEDIRRWREHELDTRQVIGENGRMTELAGEFSGMKIDEARSAILDKLKEMKLLLQQHKITHVVNVGERSKTPVEFMPVSQWFITVLDSKDELIRAADDINWYPTFMKQRYVAWIENLKWDWNISRQRYYGVPFPVWYSKKTGDVILPDETQLPVDPTVDKPNTLPEGHTYDDIIAETDVMDTWMTSSVTPLIAAEWGGENEHFDVYPSSLRAQAHDIIRTWAFYTITKSLYHHNSKPWQDIMISGHGLDPKGKKMSKSVGNVIDPEKMMNLFSADALRYWTASGKLGEDVAFQEKELVTGKKTINKIWNASNFASMHLEHFDGSRPNTLTRVDEWILAKLNVAVEKATSSFECYEYSAARHAIDHFFWKDLCDNYLEIVKDRLYKPEVYGDDAKRSAQFTLHTVFTSVLKLYAPIMPFVTEASYQYMFKSDDESVHITSWPQVVSDLSEDVIEDGDALVEAIAAIRSAKSNESLALNAELSSLTITNSFSTTLEQFVDDIKAVAKTDAVSFVEGEELTVTFVKKE